MKLSKIIFWLAVGGTLGLFASTVTICLQECRTNQTIRECLKESKGNLFADEATWILTL